MATGADPVAFGLVQISAGAALANSLTKKAPYKGRGADSGEKREPASDIDTAVVDSVKALDPNRPIREADMPDKQSQGIPILWPYIAARDQP